MNVDPEKFTELGITAIQEMAEVARRNGQQEVEVWHLLSALINQENGIVPALLEDMGVGSAPIQLALQRELQNLPKIAGNVNTARSYASSALTEAVEKGQSISRGNAGRLCQHGAFASGAFFRWKTCRIQTVFQKL